MLMSFLATIEDGYYLSSNVSRKAARSRKGQARFAGEGGLSNIASLLGLKTTVSGQYKREKSIDSNVVETFVREHTAASMFNRLYELLEAADLIKRLHVADGLYETHARDIVEISGTVTENPIEYLFDLMNQALPIVTMIQSFNKAPEPSGQEHSGETPQPPQLSGDALDNPLVADVLEKIRADFSGGPVTDIVLDAGFCRVVITANREFLTDGARASLVDGSFTTLGKITNVGHSAGDSLSIVRRGSLAAFSQIQSSLESLVLSTQGELASKIPSTEVKGPYIQILPLAIYI